MIAAEQITSCNRVIDRLKMLKSDKSLNEEAIWKNLIANQNYWNILLKKHYKIHLHNAVYDYIGWHVGLNCLIIAMLRSRENKHNYKIFSFLIQKRTEKNTSRAPSVSKSTHPRKFGNHMTVLQRNVQKKCAAHTKLLFC